MSDDVQTTNVFAAVLASVRAANDALVAAGVLPALIVFWIRRNIPESPRWEESHRRRRAAYDLRRQGAALKGEDAALVRFTLFDMFSEPAVRTHLFLTFVMSLSVTIGYWGVSSFVPSYVGSVATAAAAGSSAAARMRPSLSAR